MKTKPNVRGVLLGARKEEQDQIAQTGQIAC